MRSAQLGFTLVELMVGLSIMGALLLSLVPFTVDWIHSSQTRDASAKLKLAYGLAKGTALRNPQALRGSDPAASLIITSDGTTTTLLTCSGPSTGAECKANGSAVVWTSSYPANVATELNGVLLTPSQAITLELTNRSERIGAGSFTLARGSANNTQSGNLD
jgi:prepilin-type N-terminal cleavage/methylation domain-containing protein